ncbi:MAG: hypothetical protein V5A36_04770 [Natronomonas sp.]
MVGETTSGRLEGALRSVRGTEDDSDELTNPWIAAAAVLLLVLLPLLPFLAIVWRISRTLKGVRKRVSWE